MDVDVCSYIVSVGVSISICSVPLYE